MSAFQAEWAQYQNFITANTNTQTQQAGQAVFTFTTINLKVAAVEKAYYGVDPNAPVVDLNGGASGVNNAVTFTEDGGAVNIAPSGAVTDLNSANLASMIVTFTNCPDGTAEKFCCSTRRQPPPPPG